MGEINMKLWEVIKELDENPNKKFISTVDSSRPEEKRKLVRVGNVIEMINDSTFWVTDEFEEVNSSHKNGEVL